MRSLRGAVGPLVLIIIGLWAGGVTEDITLIGSGVALAWLMVALLRFDFSARGDSYAKIAESTVEMLGTTTEAHAIVVKFAEETTLRLQQTFAVLEAYEPETVERLMSDQADTFSRLTEHHV